MQHSFDVELAEKYGILEAILLNHLWFWIEKNRANDRNYHDGYYWTYNSVKAFSELFPYASKNKINNALNHLKAEGLIITGNYNQSAYDRTLWYAITNLGKSIIKKSEMEIEEKENGNLKYDEPIPDKKPDKKPDKQTDIRINYQLIVNMYNETCVSFPKLRQLSESRKKAIKARLKTYDYEDFQELFERAEASSFLKGSNNRNWSATFDWLIKDANMAKVLDGNYNDVEYERPKQVEIKYDDDANEDLQRMIKSMRV